MHQQPQSPLFRLPPELRNNIYELVFSPAEVEEVELTSAKSHAPSAALTLACKRINSEACGLYKAASQTYWSSITFTLSGRNVFDDGLMGKLQGLSVRALALMRQIGIRIINGDFDATVRLTKRKGEWTCAVSSTGELPEYEKWQVMRICDRDLMSVLMLEARGCLEGSVRSSSFWLWLVPFGRDGRGQCRLVQDIETTLRPMPIFVSERT